MNRRTPNLETLIEPHLARHDRRLRQAHDALLRAGPVPALPASLRRPPRVAARRRVPLGAGHGRRVLVAVAAAFALAAGLFATLRPAAQTASLVAMHATAGAPGARGTLRIGARDAAGNSPITLRVGGLPQLPSGSYYEVDLVDKGRLVGSCGTFRSGGGATIVRLNAPYAVGEYSGWLIRLRAAGQPPGPPLLTTES